MVVNIGILGVELHGPDEVVEGQLGILKGASMPVFNCVSLNVFLSEFCMDVFRGGVSGATSRTEPDFYVSAGLDEKPTLLGSLHC